MEIGPDAVSEVFPSSPITEGLIDIRVEPAGNLSVTDLEKIHTRIKDNYPNKKTRRTWQGTVELKGEKEYRMTEQTQVDGYLFSTSDEKQVVQYRLDGFTFSRLRPYTKWEAVYPEAQRLWDIYKAAAKPLRVTRVALRYINSIEFPLEQFELSDYFTAAPTIPKGLPQTFQTFFTRSTIPFPARGVVAIVIQTPSGKKDPAKFVIVLDIDVFAVVNLEPDDQKIHEIFSILRETKNEVFLKSITDRTKELFR